MPPPAMFNMPPPPPPLIGLKPLPVIVNMPPPVIHKNSGKWPKIANIEPGQYNFNIIAKVWFELIVGSVN